MAFRQANFSRLVRFNSADSSDFLNMYENHVETKIAAKNAEPKSKTFAPSSVRCKRLSWFRLRGVEPDKIQHVDRVTEFTAEIGTACHEIIQKNLSEILGDCWIDVGDYLSSINFPYEYTIERSGYETRVSIPSIPIKFACDGLIRWKGKIWLLEIKTSEFSSFDELTNMKDQHVDQVVTYASIFNIHDVLVLYQDRQYGSLKCYERHVSDTEMITTFVMFDEVKRCVDANIAPDRLPKGDIWCSRCIYSKRCKEWG